MSNKTRIVIVETDLTTRQVFYSTLDWYDWDTHSDEERPNRDVAPLLNALSGVSEWDCEIDNDVTRVKLRLDLHQIADRDAIWAKVEESLLELLDLKPEGVEFIRIAL